MSIQKPAPIKIVILAKAPLPGLVKTRLIPALGEYGAARLAERLLIRTLLNAIWSRVGSIELCVSPDPDAPEWEHTRRILPLSDHPLIWTTQGDGDLGARMARAAERGTAAGHLVMLMGTDCPTLDPRRIRQAGQTLQKNDAVMIPAVDGGYVLLGLRHTSARLFEDVPWSTDAVADTTLRRLRELGWKHRVLPSLRDLDVSSDLEALPAWIRRALCV